MIKLLKIRIILIMIFFIISYLTLINYKIFYIAITEQ